MQQLAWGACCGRQALMLWLLTLSPAGAQGWKQFMNVVNSAHYIAVTVADWAEEPFLVTLFTVVAASAPGAAAGATRRGVAAKAVGCVPA